MDPPILVFKSPIFHPNFYTTGKVCLDRLQSKWSSAYTICTLMDTLRLLLVEPNPDSPANLEAARLYTDNRPVYEQRVRESVEMSWIHRR
jgi:ubiquitin-conjugating enzyme E2 A